MSYLAFAARVLVLVVFAAAALSKVRARAAFRGFVGSLAAFVWLPTGLRRPVAVATVLVEATAAGLVTTRFTAAAGLALAAAAIGTFTVSMTIAARRGPVSCRCFGAGTATWDGTAIARNGMVLLVVIAGLPASVGQPDRPAATGGLVLAAAAAAACGLAVIRWNDVLFVLGLERR